MIGGLRCSFTWAITLAAAMWWSIRAGALVNREEFTPYGETSFGSFAKKRYRFTGKERDEESGLNYHGAQVLCAMVGTVGESGPQRAVK